MGGISLFVGTSIVGWFSHTQPRPGGRAITVSYAALSQDRLQGRVVQHGVGQQPFQPRFSSSSVFSRLASDTSNPPNLAFHL
jgi:hypothetical protein